MFIFIQVMVEARRAKSIRSEENRRFGNGERGRRRGVVSGLPAGTEAGPREKISRTVTKVESYSGPETFENCAVFGEGFFSRKTAFFIRRFGCMYVLSSCRTK